MPTSNATIKTYAAHWHQRLGHPSRDILKFVFRTFNLSSHLDFESCESCLCNKSHRLPFGKPSLCSPRPLDLIYSDVWGPDPVTSFDNYKYYVIFVDHFTKYVWFFPLRLKSDVFSIFVRFKTLVQNYFLTTIRNIYTDGGSEFLKLTSFFQQTSINHLLTPPYTPQHNGAAERRHRHIVEMGLALLHQVSLPPSFWTFAFQTATYLINCLPSKTTFMTCPFQLLFDAHPNYANLRVFGCLCFPWLRPYTRNKLEPRSKPWVFLDYCP